MTSALRAAALLLPLTLLTGCGGDSAPSGATSGLDKPAYIAASEKVCKAANDESDALKEPAAASDVVAFFDKQIGIFDAATTELEDLAADQPDASELKKIFTGPLRQQVETIQAYKPKLEEAAKKGEEALAALEDPEPVEADLTAMKDYGFTECVESASTE